MNIKPSENLALFGLDHYFTEIINLHFQKKMPNKILLSGKKGIGKSTLAYHIINSILSCEEEEKYNLKKFTINKNNKSYKLLQTNTHPNIFLIDLIEEKKVIDINQIRSMIQYTNKSNFNNLPRFILIDNIENLNKNSINALLKILEEPNVNLFFILINNSEKYILPTLKSRCLNFKINLTHNQSIEITNSILQTDLMSLINVDLINYYFTPGDFINLINFANEKKIDLKKISLTEFLNISIKDSLYKKNSYAKLLLFNFIEMFFLKELKFKNSKNNFFKVYSDFINKVNNTEKFNLDEESLFLEFRSKILND
jgi:DNA polymerase III subunit delta'